MRLNHLYALLHRNPKKDELAQAAIAYASRWQLGGEVARCINQGYSPEQALEEWDVLTSDIIDNLNEIRENER